MCALSDETTLDLGDSPQGNVTYSIMLRFDANTDMRSMYLVVDAGEASSTPSPKAPDTTLANIVEYRLGYAYVPSGATDMSEAVIVNEKGLAVCPYSAPFDELDVSAILVDVQTQATAAYTDFIDLLNQNIDYLNSAIGDTLAGELIAAINAETVARQAADTAINATLSADPTDAEFLAYLES